ncbi:MAG: DUF523 domain-containing protein [Dissulfuribacterales bacterium]
MITFQDRTFSERNRMVLVSACLIGLSCRYDGKSNRDIRLIDKLRGANVLPVCPEQLGGLTTPRPAADIYYGNGIDVLNGRAKVLNVNGQDVTEAFKRGAEQTAFLAKALGVNQCFLKAGSPSCGITAQIGVTAAKLLLKGFDIKEIR